MKQSLTRDDWQNVVEGICFVAFIIAFIGIMLCQGGPTRAGIVLTSIGAGLAAVAAVIWFAKVLP